MTERRTGPFLVRALLVLALGGAAYAVNLFPWPLAFGLHLLFGGFFSMLAAILYGPWAGLVAGLLGALPTVELWGHPYALLSMTLEATVVGWEARRGRSHHTETDLLYWLFVGAPLVTIAYSFGAHIPLMATGVAALKQAVNGLVYTTAASVMLLLLVWWQRGRRTLRLEVVLANLITFLVMLPLAAALAWTTQESGRHLRTQLSAEATQAGTVVRAGLLQELADLRSQLRLLASQPSEFTERFSLPAGLQHVWLVDAQGMTVAEYPPAGAAAPPVGPGVALSNLTPVPGLPGPTVLLAEPGGVAGEVQVTAALDLERLAGRVMGLVAGLNTEVAVIDRTGTVVLSSWDGIETGAQFAGQLGEPMLFSVPAGLRGAERVTFVDRVQLAPLGMEIYVRKPLGQVEYLLYRSYLNSFIIAVGMIIVLLITIRVVAYTVTRPLVQLAAVTVSSEGEMANLSPNQSIWVAEVRAVASHMAEIGARIQDLIRSLHITQRELERHNVELAVANAHLADEALRDARTGLSNRRAFWQQVQLWVEANKPFALVLADLQGLKPYAEDRGELRAEEFLAELAADLQQHAALYGGEAFQYGPERFALLFPESSEWLVERVLLGLPTLAVLQGAANEQRPLLVAGAARFPEDGPTGPALVEAADRRLAMKEEKG